MRRLTCAYSVGKPPMGHSRPNGHKLRLRLGCIVGAAGLWLVESTVYPCHQGCEHDASHCDANRRNRWNR